MAERFPTKEQRYQMNSQPQMKQKIHYAAVEEEYYSNEDEVYVTRASHPKPYNTNRKAQKEAQREVQKKSESQKEIKLRTRTVQAYEPEFEDMIEELIEVLKPTKASRKKI